MIAGTLAASLLLHVPAEASGTMNYGMYEAADADDTDYSRELAKRSQETDPEDAVIVVPEGMQANEPKNHTVMIYMIGSNLESRMGNATRDIEEMRSAALSFENVNVLLYTGGSRRWVGEVPCDRNCVIDLSKSSDENIVASTEGNANMGAPETLSGFINFASEYYPAEHNTLIFWDHGGGPLWGYGSDELFDSDSLLLSELQSAMEATEYASEKKLDLVGFDACLMASLENMSLWQNYADYFVASEELEPGNGWDYNFLSIFEKTSDAALIGEAIVDYYMDFYKESKTKTSNPDLTLSLIDLSMIPGVNDALDVLAALMTDDLSGGAYASIVQKRAAAKSFGLSQNSSGYISYYYDLVDLADLGDKLSEYYEQETKQLMKAVNESVIYGFSNIEGAGGISLYFPLRNKTQYTQMKVPYQGMTASPNYTKFLARNAAQWVKSRGRSWDLGTLSDDGNEYTLQLTEEQIANMTGADVTILAESPAGGYVPYLSSMKLEPDENGKLHIPKSLPLVALKMENGEYMVWPVTEIDSDETRTVYKTDDTLLRSDVTYSNHMTDMERENVSVTMAKERTTGEITILSFDYSGDPEMLGGKSEIEIEHWEELYFYQYPAYTTKDESGRIMPFRDWTQTGVVSWSDMPIEEGFFFEEISSEDTGLDLVCQVEITDINGENYASAAAVMSASDDYREVSVDTLKGELIYAVYADHAAVIDYSGRDRLLSIPGEIEGVPVTEIGDSAFGKLSYFSTTGTYVFQTMILPDSIEKIGANAFYSCTKLKSINMPASLKSIGSLAFYSCRSLEQVTLSENVMSIGKCAFAYCSSLKSVTLPDSVASIGFGALMGCENLESIELGGANETYRMIDGSLYSADGTVLLAVPAAAAEELVIHEGTKSIAYGACASASIRQVYLPESLESIGNFAFYSCNELNAPVLPDGLLEIGYHAFDTYSMALDPEDVPEEAQEISIGSALLWLGDHALDCFVRKNVTVSADNSRFSSSGGALMNGAGDAVVALSVDANGQVVIPEGTVAFDFEMLEFLDGLNELSSGTVHRIYLPESLQRFPEDVHEYQYRNLLFHCAKGSAAEEFMLKNGIPYSAEMSSEYTVTTVETDAGVITARVYEDHAMITAFKGDGETLEIPAEVEGRPVRVIGDGENPISVNGYYYGFNANMADTPNLIAVLIPEGVEEIAANALCSFSRTNNVEVTLPSTVKSIGAEALTGCVINAIPEGIERLGRSFIDSLPDEGFTLTPSVVYIDPQAFSSCSGLSEYKSEGVNETYSVADGVLFSSDGSILISFPHGGDAGYEVPEGTVTVGAHAFDGCMNLKSVILPGTLRSIEDYAFYSCWNLSDVEFADGSVIDIIGSSAFRSCRNLETISLSLVKEIGDDAFASCTALTEVTFRQGLRVIGNYAFSETNISDLQLPDSTRSVGNYAFYSYAAEPRGSSDDLHIGLHMTYIGTEAFADIGAKAFDVDTSNSYYASIDGFLTDKAGNTILDVPSGMEGEVWVPDGITGIASGAFLNANKIEKLHIPASVEFISTLNFEYKEADEPDEEGNTVYLYNVTIYCRRNSAAHIYALENGIPFVLER